MCSRCCRPHSDILRTPFHHLVFLYRDSLLRRASLHTPLIPGDTGDAIYCLLFLLFNEATEEAWHERVGLTKGASRIREAHQNATVSEAEEKSLFSVAESSRHSLGMETESQNLRFWYQIILPHIVSQVAPRSMECQPTSSATSGTVWSRTCRHPCLRR